MKKLNILLFDWRFPRDIIEKALASELNASIFNLTSCLKEQLRNNDDLGKEMMKLVENGEMLTKEIIGRFISRNLQTFSGNILLSEYPRTLEQYDGLTKVLKNDKIELQGIWYFKQREPNQFMKKHFENPKEKQWIDKYGSEVIKKWKIEFNKRRELIVQIQNISDTTKWKTIEVDYASSLNAECIKQLIKYSVNG
ncbi:nucleoside monophosphate kinase [Tenacibaculum sp. 190524A02b]|uniref:nucleoside monophosphate kinase n=1 Tax=Tenacibaculum vairaonense TaxID=3137860 RepID=UPI0031FA87BE